MTDSIKHFSRKGIPLLFAAAFFLGILLLLFSATVEYRDVLEDKEKALAKTLADFESGFAPFFQLASTSAVLSGTLPLTIDAHERFLEGLFSSSQSELVYGTGIWYEPEIFAPGQIRYGPYIRFDDPLKGSSSISYEWNTAEYDYHNSYWYRLIFDSDSDEEGIVVSVPFFDTDYNYITIGKPFFRDGVKAGVITVDIIFPLLESFFSRYDLTDYLAVYLMTSENELIYTLKGGDLFGPELPFKGEDTNDLLSALLEEEKFNIHPFELESEDKAVRIHGFLDVDRVYRNLLKVHGYRFGIFFTLWLALLVLYLCTPLFRRQKNRNIRLSDENDSLKVEIEKRVKAEHQLQFLAFHDPVTNLDNLNSFFELEEPKVDAENRFLIQVSLNNIREISSILERKLIDRLLLDFAFKLIQNSPESSKQFRGNGFVFYIVNEGESESLRLAELLLKEFSKTILLHKRSVRFRIRIGITPFREAKSLENILNLSQSALSESGNPELNRIVRYSSELEYRKSFHIAIDAEMGRENFIDELRMVYQPIIRMEDREIAGVEALVRWDSSYFCSTIPPDEFIPLAEENGYIIELGWFVLKEALGLLSRELKGKNWFVSVNVSPIQFIESDFADKLERLVDSFSIDKSRLKIEITETSAAARVPFFWQTIDILIRKGFRLAIDDFGTGESSFGRLYSYAFDTLKIDRSLIRDIVDNPRNQKIFRSILRLGEVLDNNIIAEGIEEEEEHKLLKAFGLKYAQGYLYSKPKNIEDLLD